MRSLLLIPFILSPVLSHELNDAQKWGYGILTSFALGLLGFVAAIILVQLQKWLNTDAFKVVIKFFFSLACGTLLGDAIIHILAEAYDEETLNNYYVSLIFILSLVGFIVLQKIFLKCGISHEHWIQEGHHHHGVSPQNNQEKASQSNNQLKQTVNPEIVHPSSEIIQPNNENVEQVVEEKNCFQALKGKGNSGYMNLIGSTIHNTIDGLSIGLAFSTGESSNYIPIVIAIFIHEIPRQLGDVAILLKSKFSPWQTVCSNGLINMLAIVGAIIGLSTSSLSDQAKDYIMIFVAGNFVYIASDIWKHLLNDKWKHNLVEALGFAIGVGAMFAVKVFQTVGGGEEGHEGHSH